jgi:ferrochelatase
MPSPAQQIGILLSNLGTPDEPTPPALRRYLREFLGDPRVVELSRPLWKLILELFVLPTRPAKSARLYRKVWTAEGSPLLAGTLRLGGALAGRLRNEGIPAELVVGMRYGNPSIRTALARLRESGCSRILVLPLYPQYSASTSGSTLDAVGAELARWRVVPALRFVRDYHLDPGWIAAVAGSIRSAWQVEPPAERLLFSFHGLPKRYVDRGDVYADQCRRSAEAIAAELGLPEERWMLTFQSRFGREEWLRPYTDQTLAGLPNKGIRSLDVACPGFAVDCLETLEEIGMLNREIFLGAGGERYRYLPCLNDGPESVSALAGIVRRELGGWI